MLHAAKVATQPFPLDTQPALKVLHAVLVDSVVAASEHWIALQAVEPDVESTVQYPSLPIRLAHPADYKYVLHNCNVAAQPYPVDKHPLIQFVHNVIVLYVDGASVHARSPHVPDDPEAVHLHYLAPEVAIFPIINS